MPRAARAGIGVVLALVAGLLLAGCRVDAAIGVEGNDSGGGTVTLRVRFDQEAASLAALAGPIEERVYLDDLQASGWELLPTERADDGSVTVRIRQSFADEAELESLIADLVGDSGVVGEVSYESSQGLLRSKDALAMEIDLRGLESGVRGDAALAQRLTQAGVDVNALDTRFSEGLQSALVLDVRLAVPGEEPEVERVKPGEEANVAVASSSFDVDRLMLLLISLFLGALALVLAVAALMSNRRRHSRLKAAQQRRTIPMRPAS